MLSTSRSRAGGRSCICPRHTCRSACGRTSSAHLSRLRDHRRRARNRPAEIRIWKRRGVSARPPAPRKPRSARRLFTKANAARARHEYPDASESELKIILHEMWNRLPSHAREEYERGAADELERYNREMAEYQTEEPGAL